MSYHATLQVTGMFRGDNPDRPVHVGHTDTGLVVAVLDPETAVVLARMVARVTGQLRDVDDVDQVLWDHVTVDLLAAAASTTTPDHVVHARVGVSR